MEEARSPKEHSTSTSGRRAVPAGTKIVPRTNVLKTRKLWKVTVTKDH